MRCELFRAMPISAVLTSTNPSASRSECTSENEGKQNISTDSTSPVTFLHGLCKLIFLYSGYLVISKVVCTVTI